jgi:hypothetical protein
VVALCLLAFSGSAQAARPHIAVGCAHAVTAKQGIDTARAVWPPSRWHRGTPKPAAIAAHRRQVRCAAGPGHRAAIKHRWEVTRRRFYKRRHYCLGGIVVRGRVSVFGGGLTASGVIASTTPGLALNIDPSSEPSGWNNATTAAWISSGQRFRVTIVGHIAILPVIDAGPASWTGRSIDVTEPGAAVLGLSVSAFPTDSIGVAKLIPPGCL